MGGLISGETAILGTLVARVLGGSGGSVRAWTPGYHHSRISRSFVKVIRESPPIRPEGPAGAGLWPESFP